MRKFVFVVVLALTTVAWAQNPFVGTWKLNPAKGHYTDTTFSYTETSPGHFIYKSGSESWEFNTDGKDYPTTLPTATVSWRKIGPNQWRTTYKLDGKVTTEMDRTVSADGKFMTTAGTSTADDGTPSQFTNKFERISGGPGVAGVWRTSNAKFEGDVIIVISEPANNSMSIDAKHDKMIATGPTDGQTPWTITSPHADALRHISYTMLRSSPRTASYSNLRDGKVITKGAMTVSEDGMTLTDTSWDPQLPNEKTIDVFEKQ